MKNSLLQETLALRDRYDDEPPHSDHVANLALQIFDDLSPALQLPGRSRELLQSGALLHDVGWSQTAEGRGHHKQSAKLIREYDWKALDAEEVAIVAQIARYHRRKLPQPEHEDFQKLPAGAQKQVMVLAGILRVADALDRTHSGRIVRASAKITGKTVTVRVQPQPEGNWEAELAIFKLKRDMLELALGRAVKCEEGDDRGRQASGVAGG